MHIGHFGSRTSSVPEPIHPLALRHQLCCAVCPAGAWQQFIAPILPILPIGADGFPSLCREEADFRPMVCIAVKNIL
jgi:hypothetical protein